jgi:hypothetical protein
VRFELFVDSPMKKRQTKKLTPERLQQFGFAYAPPLIISAAVNNKVFDTLESGPKTVEQVKKKLARLREACAQSWTRLSAWNC